MKNFHTDRMIPHLAGFLIILLFTLFQPHQVQAQDCHSPFLYPDPCKIHYRAKTTTGQSLFPPDENMDGIHLSGRVWIHIPCGENVDSSKITYIDLMSETKLPVKLDLRKNLCMASITPLKPLKEGRRYAVGYSGFKNGKSSESLEDQFRRHGSPLKNLGLQSSQVLFVNSRSTLSLTYSYQFLFQVVDAQSGSTVKRVDLNRTDGFRKVEKLSLNPFLNCKLPVAYCTAWTLRPDAQFILAWPEDRPSGVFIFPPGGEEEVHRMLKSFRFKELAHRSKSVLVFPLFPNRLRQKISAADLMQTYLDMADIFRFTRFLKQDQNLKSSIVSAFIPYVWFQGGFKNNLDIDKVIVAGTEPVCPLESISITECEINLWQLEALKYSSREIPVLGISSIYNDSDFESMIQFLGETP